MVQWRRESLGLLQVRQCECRPFLPYNVDTRGNVPDHLHCMFAREALCLQNICPELDVVGRILSRSIGNDRHLAYLGINVAPNGKHLHSVLHRNRALHVHARCLRSSRCGRSEFQIVSAYI